ncbi:MAG: hypothetical protein KAJ51_00545, partial [Thermoplasmata archaeon]|nr:hypothetical protein [Thermoplasmata archaeon]
ISAVWSMVGYDNDNQYEAESTVELVVEERFYEPALAGTIYIASPKTKYNSGIQELVWDAVNRYYTFTWLTNGLTPSDDYYIETTLIDRRGNADSDGLPITPDLIIRLIDTTPPKPVTDLEATQEASDITKVHLTWNTTEPDSKLHIYRTTVPISNITDLEPLITITGNQITDTLPPEPGTYYYIVLIEDSSGNLNSKITPSNTAKATIPGPQPYIDPNKAQVEEGDDGLWLWLALILGVIIILAIIGILYFIYPKSNENKDMSAHSQEPQVQTPYQDSETLSEQSGPEIYDYHNN